LSRDDEIIRPPLVAAGSVEERHTLQLSGVRIEAEIGTILVERDRVRRAQEQLSK
jgi:hypothetical protein